MRNPDLRSAQSLISQYLERIQDLKNLRLLVAKVKNISYEQIAFSPENVFLTENEEQAFRELLVRFKQDEPISKLLNRKPFWEQEYFVNSDVLNPRPETELIIEMILSRFDKELPLNFLDIGTGSGCLLLSLLSEFKNSKGIGIDISEKAIEVAKINRERLQIKNATFQNVSWNDFCAEEKFDVIVSNPPYIKTKDIEKLDDNVKNFDPVLALDGGADGLVAYREISALAKGWMAETGVLFFEVGYNQAQDVVAILVENGFKCGVQKDFSAIERIIYTINA